MSKKLRLTKIELETKEGKKVSLSIEEAKDLHDQLHELFGQSIRYIPSSPIMIERDCYPWQDRIIPYYSTGSNIVTCEVKGDSGLNVSYTGREE